MAAWKIAPALAAGNCTVLKPASPTPWSILKLAEVIEDVVPPGVINIVTGPGAEVGKALATSPRIAKIGFTGETVTGRLMMQYAAENLIPVTLELGGKSPNVFFEDVMASDDDFLDKAIEGLVLYAFNKGEVCTCPSRALIQESIYDEFMARCLDRIAAIKQGNPLDETTMLGPQVSAQQLSKIIRVRRDRARRGRRGADRWAAAKVGGEFEKGYFYEPTVLKGDNRMRVFQEEIFGPVLAVTTFQDEAEALRIANDTLYGLGAGVWTRDDQPDLADEPRHPGRTGLGELLPPVPGGCRLRWLQDLRRRPGEPPDDARALQPDQERAHQHRREEARTLLTTGSASRTGAPRVRSSPRRAAAGPPSRGCALHPRPRGRDDRPGRVEEGRAAVLSHRPPDRVANRAACVRLPRPSLASKDDT